MSNRKPVLGRTVKGTLRARDIDLLPIPAGVENVTIRTTELQAVCPVTGQPDIYAAEVFYAPDRHVLESKAVKMYLLRWRDVGISCEALAATIARDLGKRLGAYVSVTLTQQVRGGLVIEATATHTPKEKP